MISDTISPLWPEENECNYPSATGERQLRDSNDPNAHSGKENAQP